MTETAYLIGNKNNLAFLVRGSQTVLLSSGAGTVTVTSVATIDQVVRMDTDDSSSTVEHLTLTTGSPSTNTVAVQCYTNTLSGPTLATSSGSSVTVNYVIIGH